MKNSESKNKSIIPGGVDEYIAKFPPSIQAKLSSLRKSITDIAPGATETVSYFGIPGYAYEGYDYNGMFVWFSYDNRDLRLHVIPPVLEDFAKETMDYNKTKSIIKFSPDKEIPSQLVKKLTKASLNIVIKNSQKSS